MEISLRLKRFCETQGITQYRLSKHANINLGSISRFWTGKCEPSSEILARIVEAYPEINIRWLLTGKGEMLEKTAPMEVSVSG